MKSLRNLLIASAIVAAIPAQAQITAFKHIVVIVQENRTPDNLFWELCQYATCSTTDLSKYDIQTTNWNNAGKPVNPAAIDLAIGWDIGHGHKEDWVSMCDQSGSTCLMDGAAKEVCHNGNTNGCTTNNNLPEFTYVQRYNGTTDVLGPYISLAQTYGWANLMFQTNQGPSFPAHQFIYGGTSAPSSTDDSSGIYAAENIATGPNGCLAPQGAAVELITRGVENSKTYPCFKHETLGQLFNADLPGDTWKYYTPTEGDLWTAPDALLSECGASNQHGGVTSCPGSEFSGSNPNVITHPKQILTDITNCQLSSMSWVIPKGQYSDHAGSAGDKGPEWVASIVNSIGASSCADNGETYWQDTAIVITWDDWGGWYDHEAPQLNTSLGYQLGFRVPLLFVSAYGPNNTGGQCVGYIEGSGANQSEALDFGTIDNFIENNFLGSEGALGFADARALQRSGKQDLSDFYNLGQSACAFQPIPVTDPTSYFVNDTSAPLPPDDE